MSRFYWSFGGGVIMLMFCVTVFLLKPAPSVVTFDFTRTKGQFIHQLALKKASNELVLKASNTFNRQLKIVLEGYAKTHRVVILDNAQVISTGRDITDSIVPLLATAMRGNA